MLQDLINYRDLLNYLQTLSPAQLDQRVQITKQEEVCLNDIITLQPGICIGTVDEMEFTGTRSVVDNRYHGNEIVILTDANPFGKDGAQAYEIKDGKVMPLFGPEGPTTRESQLNPKDQDDMPASEVSILKNRVKNS